MTPKKNRRDGKRKGKKKESTSFLFRSEIVLVSLGKYEEGLVPQGGELPLVVHELHEILVYCINHLFYTINNIQIITYRKKWKERKGKEWKTKEKRKREKTKNVKWCSAKKYLVRQRELLVKEDHDEVLRGTIVGELAKLVDCHTRVHSGNLDTFHDRTYNCSLAEGTVTRFAEGQKNSSEECGRSVDWFLLLLFLESD